MMMANFIFGKRRNESWDTSNGSRARHKKEIFKEKMCEIEKFCEENNISHSSSYDSYYFEIKGQKYRVSNHSPESSPYHWGRDADTRYINASKLRIIQIYINLMYGSKLNGHGCVIE